MASSGGLIDLELAAANAAACVLSGPAGGVVGAAHVAGLAGFDDVLTLDMGGTSTDVAPIVGGRLGTTHESVIAGVPVGLPTVDVHTVSAGGGSIARLDAGGVLRAGPESAGARPGPASYGLGGTEAAVTDAERRAGLPGRRRGAGRGGAARSGRWPRRRCSPSRRRSAAKSRRPPPAWSPSPTPRWRARCARISVERGLDPRDFALLAFGGAGPLHACALAEELGHAHRARAARERRPLGAGPRRLGRAPRPRRAGTGRRRRTRRRWRPSPQRAAAELPGAALERTADVRYRGQSFELEVAGRRPRRAARALPRGPRAALRLPPGRRARRGRAAARGRDALRRRARRSPRGRRGTAA